MATSSIMAIRESARSGLDWSHAQERDSESLRSHYEPTLPPEQRERIDREIDSACGRIAPLWPLKHFVAVNPFFGLQDKNFQDASDTLARILGYGIYMPRDYYREQLAAGRITDEDLQLAIDRCVIKTSLNLTSLKATLAQPAPQAAMGMEPVSTILEHIEGRLWGSFVMEQISRHCAAYFDLGQATIAMPWRDLTLYQAWRKVAAIDMSPAMMGLSGFRASVTQLPENPRDAIAWAIEKLEIPEPAVERYLHASLLSIGGWAAWTRYLRWQAELEGSQDSAIVDLLAIRVMWDILLYQEKYSFALAAQWRGMLESSMRPPSAKRRKAAEVDRILLSAMEIGFQRQVAGGLYAPAPNLEVDQPVMRPAVQAAFCIDVRSEIFRRSLETVSSRVQTIGFAGFFGVFMEFQPLGADAGNSHAPVLFKPADRVQQELNTDETTNRKACHQRRERLALSKLWKRFKYSASSTFSFVEATGMIYIPKLLSDSFGWTRPVPDPATQGLDEAQAARLRPVLKASSCCVAQHHHQEHAQAQDPGAQGIPEDSWVDHAERILTAMGMTRNFARIVLLTGHGSSSVNNPHATSLDCGACAGQTGEASARVAASLLNQESVRRGLLQRGIEIPSDTWFVAALHNTTTDTVTLFDLDEMPQALAKDREQLERWLEQAGELSRLQRAGRMGVSEHPSMALKSKMLRRANDWSQVRPEWALANNAAFIAAPRERTQGSDLEGRAFLHDYNWRDDKGFKVLELIMTAPMVVANWINMQYYGSVVDNDTFGSGNKVLHNVVGGAIGVLEGNGGDLRVGLPMQSLHNGQRWMHEPLRLSVFIEAPSSAMEDIIERHDSVRQLVDNGWLVLFQIAEDGSTLRRAAQEDWRSEF